MATHRWLTLCAAIGIAVLEVWLFIGASAVAYPPYAATAITTHSNAAAPVATVKATARLPLKRTHPLGSRPGVRSK